MTKSPPSIVACMDEPRLWGKLFKGASFDNWRVVLKSLMGEPLNDTELAAFRTLTGRTEAPTSPSTEIALVCGRRAGKSRIISLVAVWAAVFRSYEQYLAPGEVATVACISVDRKAARTLMRYISGLLHSTPALESLIDDEGQEYIKLNNRVQIEVATANGRATRGYTFAAVLVDESAFLRDENAAASDEELFRAVRPGMSSIPGSILLNSSSPYRRSGVLWKTYKRDFGRDDARVLVIQAPTEMMNPKVDKAIIAEAYADDPVSAASEYGAQFRSDIADFVSREVVEACIDDGVFERPRSAGARYVGFIDAAGGSGSDSMTLAIATRERENVVVAAIRERKPPFSPDDVVTEFAALLKSYGITRCESDRWGGDWVVEAFRKRGITVVPSAKPKNELYREMLPVINGRRALLLDNAKLINQLCSLERRVGSSGRDVIDHAPNQHDDVANAVAGVLAMASLGRQPMKFSQAFLSKLGPSTVAARL